MVRRLARISETTWFINSRSCALREICVAQLVGVIPESGRTVAECEQRRRIARCELVPGILRMSEVLACRLQLRIFLDRVAVAPRRRDGLAQMVGFLHFAHARGRR